MTASQRVAAVYALLTELDRRVAEWMSRAQASTELVILVQGRPSCPGRILVAPRGEFAARLATCGPELRRFARRLGKGPSGQVPVVFHPAPGQRSWFELAWWACSVDASGAGGEDGDLLGTTAGAPRCARRAALHEAGHAVVDIALGAVPLEVSIVPRLRSRGRTCSLAFWSTARVDGTQDHPALVSLWGGIEAERRAVHKSIASAVLSGGRLDFEAAVRLAGSLLGNRSGDWEFVFSTLECARRRAAVLVRDHFAAICSLREELLRTPALTSERAMLAAAEADPGLMFAHAFARGENTCGRE